MILYFAGFETTHRSYAVELPVTANVFCSYFYRANTEAALAHLRRRRHRGIITIDSGAHSFFGFTEGAISATGKKSSGSMPDPEKYFREYLAWASRHRDRFDYFVELDIQEIVGQEVVNRWRREIAAAGLAPKCIPVWHSCNTWREWEAVVAETPSRYVGIEGLRKERPVLPYKRHLRHALLSKVGVHGFALTGLPFLREYPFFSVDSTTWTVGLRYGHTPTFVAGPGNGAPTMKQVRSRREDMMRHGVPVTMHSRNRAKADSKAKLERAVKEFLKMERYLNSLWHTRGVRWHPLAPTRKADDGLHTRPDPTGPTGPTSTTENATTP